jgi:hypothetical protein
LTVNLLAERTDGMKAELDYETVELLAVLMDEQ